MSDVSQVQKSHNFLDPTIGAAGPGPGIGAKRPHCHQSIVASTPPHLENHSPPPTHTSEIAEYESTVWTMSFRCGYAT